jgi:lysophospholipase L1-like esterase
VKAICRPWAGARKARRTVRVHEPFHATGPITYTDVPLALGHPPTLIHPSGNSFPWLLAPGLLLQGAWVRAKTPRLPEAAGPREGRAGAGKTIRLAAVGDSIVAGVGVEHTAQSLPARLAEALAIRMECQVHWTSQGSNGARTRDLLAATAQADRQDIDLVLVSNGLNDVTSLMAMDAWLEAVADMFGQLQATTNGGLIVQLGLPPLGSFPALPNPLRWVMGRRARAFDQALGRLAEQFPGVMHMPFRSVPDAALFAKDGYHPGPDAVQIWAESLADRLAPVLEAW